MYCKNCGTEIADGSRFCTNCGFDQQEAGPRDVSRYGNNGQRPNTYLVLAILVTLFCCLPFGIIGIIYAARVDSAWNSGYYEDARIFSRKAKNWSLWGIAVLFLFWIAYIILILAGVTWAAWWADDDLFFTHLL